MTPRKPSAAAATEGASRTSSGRSGDVPEQHRSWIKRAADLADEDLDGDQDWVIPGFMARGEHHQVVAEPKEGKTQLAFDLAVAVAAGQPFANFARPTRPMRVFIVEEEGRAADAHRHFARLARGREVDLENLEILVAHRTGFRLDDSACMGRIHDAIADVKPDLVILDPLSAMHQLDENAAADTRVLLDSLGHIQRDASRRLGRPGTPADASNRETAILLLHHASKTDRSGAYRGRGSSTLPAAADVIWSLRAKKDKSGRLTHIDIAFVARRPLDPIRLSIEETEDSLRLAPNAVGDEPAAGTERNGKGSTTLLSEILAYLAAVGSCQRTDIASGISRNKSGVLKAIRDALTEGVLVTVNRGGKDEIAIASASPNAH